VIKSPIYHIQKISSLSSYPSELPSVFINIINSRIIQTAIETTFTTRATLYAVVGTIPDFFNCFISFRENIRHISAGIFTTIFIRTKNKKVNTINRPNCPSTQFFQKIYESNKPMYMMPIEIHSAMINFFLLVD